MANPRDTPRPHWAMQNDVHQLTGTAHCRDKQTQTQAAAPIIVYDKILGYVDRNVELEVIAVQMPNYLLVLHVMPTH